MRIKYYTNSDHPNLGFKAKISIATCGGTMHVTSKAISHATSPSFPDSYPENSECLWNIVGPEGHYLKLDFDTFNLELPGSVDNCTDVDRLGKRNISFIESNITPIKLFCSFTLDILEKPDANQTNFEVTRTLCGYSRITPIDTLANSAQLRFISDNQQYPIMSTKKGFLININASIEGRYYFRVYLLF